MSRANDAIMSGGSPPFSTFALRVTTCHVVTYFIAGVFAVTVLDYRGIFASEALACFMRPVADPFVALGPTFQIGRGLILAAALFPFRRVFLAAPHGWLLLWGLFLGLAILSPVGPSPGSVEGFIYTKVPIRLQIIGWFEALPQTLAFSTLVVAWHTRPHRAWTWGMAGLCAIVVLLSVAGYFAAIQHRV
jgi:hypothetical protein